LHRHDLRHEGACRLLADGVDIRTIQLMLGHSDIKTTQRYLNITDEEARKALTGVLPDDFNAAVGAASRVRRFRSEGDALLTSSLAVGLARAFRIPTC
jgi:hypothetical protein